MATVLNERQKVLDGTTPRTTVVGVTVSGNTAAFIKPKSSSTLTPASVTLTATTVGYSSPTYTWSYALNTSPSTWVNIGTNTASIAVSNADFATAVGTAGAITYRCVVTQAQKATSTGTFTVNYVQEGTDGLSAINIVYTNNSLTVPVTTAGVENWTGSGGLFQVYEGATALILRSNTQTASAPSSGTVGYNLDITLVSGNTLTEPTITGATTTAGTIAAWAGDLTQPTVYRITAYIRRSNDTTVTQSVDVSISPANQGATGNPGADSTAYWLMTSAPAVQKSIGGVYTPTTVTYTIKSATGTASPADYAGRFIIATSTDGTNYTNQYTSTVNESSYTYTLPASIKTVRARAYLAGGTTILLDELITTVVSDGATGNPGVNAVNIVYTNDSLTVPVTTAGVENWTGSGGLLQVYEGNTALLLRSNTQTAAAPASGTPGYQLDITLVSGNTLTEPAITGTGTNTATIAAWAGDLTQPTVYRITAYIRRSDDTTITQSVDVSISPANQGATGNPGNDGTNGITLSVTRPAVNLPSSDGGIVSSYTNSGTDIRVFEGNTALTYVASAPAAGQFTVGAATQSPASTITNIGAYSGTATTTLTVANHNNMAQGTDNVVITYPLTVVRANGTSISLNATQAIGKAKAGVSVQGTNGGVATFAYAITSSSTLPASPSITQGTTPTASAAVASVNAANWYATPASSLSSTEWMFQVAGVRNADGTYTWTNPSYLSTFRVGTLSALTVNTGALTVDNTLTIGNTGKIISSGTAFGGNGVFLGYDVNAYKFSVGNGNANATLSFNGNTGVLTVPGGTISGTIPNAAIASSAITVDKLSIAIGGGNLITNSGFEIDSDNNGLADNWTDFVGGTGDVSRIQAASRTTGMSGIIGSYAYRLNVTQVGNTQDSGFSQNGSLLIPALPSTKYIYTGYVRSNVANQVELLIRQYNSSTAGIGDFSSAKLAVTNTWTRLSVSFTTNANTVALQPMVRGLTSVGWIEADGLQLEIGDVATAYAPRPQEINPGTIGTTQIADDAITTQKILAGQITAAKIATTSITADNIAAGAITANKISAGAVTASKLFIANFTNLVTNPNFANNAEEWSIPGQGSMVADATYGSALRLTANSGVLDVTTLAFSEVLPGENYYVEGWVRADAGSNGTVYPCGMFIYQQNKSTIAAFAAPTSVAASSIIGSTWIKYSGTITIPAGGRYIRSWVSLRNDATAGAVYYTNITTRRMNGGELIVDGAITAGKISVTSLSAVSGNMGSLTVDNTLSIGSNGVIKTSGINYNGNGIFLGRESGTNKFSVGDGTNNLSFDGTTLTVPAARLSGTIPGTVTAPGGWVNSNITIDVDGILQGIGTASTKVANTAITIDTSGIIQGIGTSSVQVDNKQSVFTPVLTWDFTTDSAGWSVVQQATLSYTNIGMTVTSTGTDPIIAVTGLSFTGRQHTKVRLRCRRLAGTGTTATLYYAILSGHSWDSGFYKNITLPPSANTDWVVLEFDMENLTAGGSDWINNTITGIRLDLPDGGATSSDRWEIDWVAVGRYGPVPSINRYYNDQITIDVNGVLQNIGTTNKKVDNGVITIGETNGVISLGNAGSGSVTAVTANNKITPVNVNTYIGETAISANYIAANAITAGKIAAGAVTTNKLIVTGGGASLSPDPNTQDLDAWIGAPGAGGSILQDTTSPTGYALRLTANNTVYSEFIPLDATKNYQARISMIQESGSSTIYGTLAFYNGSGGLLEGSSYPTGWPSYGTFHYFGVYGTTPPSSWTEYAITFGPNEVAKIPSGTKFVRIGVLANYSGGSGVQRITNLRLTEKATADLIVDGAIVASKLAVNSVESEKIAANAITATKIAAGVITAEKLLVLPGNLISNPEFATGDTRGWRPWAATGNQAVVASSGAGPSGAPSQYIMRYNPSGEVTTFAASSAYSDANANLSGFTVEPGGQYYLSIWAARSSDYVGTSFRLLAYFYKNDGTYTSSIDPIVQIPATTSWANYGGSFTAPAGAVRCWVYVYSNFSAGNLYWTKLYCGLKASAELIVDGAITTDKLNANAVTAGKIAAGSITASKLVVTNTDNIIPDPGFYDFSWWGFGSDNNFIGADQGAVAAAPTRYCRITGGMSVARDYSASTSRIPMEVGASYRARLRVYVASGTTGTFQPVLHLPNVTWFSPADANGNGFNVNIIGTAPADTWTTYTKTFTFQGNTQGNWIHPRTVANIITGEVRFAWEIVRAADADLIVDGTIVADKLATNFVYTKAINVNNNATVDSSGNAVFKSVQIQDSNGTVVLQSGGNLDFNRVGGTTKPENNANFLDLGKANQTGELFNGNATIKAGDGRPAGVFCAYSNTDLATISYQDASKTIIKLYSATDSDIGLAWQAFKVTPNTTYTIFIRVKCSASVGSGFYFRMQEYDADLGVGEYFINGTSSCEAGGVLATRQTYAFAENIGLGTSWQTFTWSYTPTSTAKWVSPNFLNWTGMGTNELHIDECIITNNANNTYVDSNGLIQGVSSNAGTPVNNTLINVDASGNLNGIGTGNGQSVANNVNSIVARPGGGLYTTTTPVVNGRLKIRLPATINNNASNSTMLKFTVDIYEYSTGRSCTLVISGHNSDATWYNVSANVVGGNTEYVVKFGYDTSNYWSVWIGDTDNQAWNYPQVLIKDVFLGYARMSATTWSTGWVISFENTPGTNITQTVNDTYPGANWSKVSGTAKPADYATSDLKLNVRGTGLVLTGNSCNRPTGGGSWDSDCYSTEGYTGGAFCSFIPSAGTSSYFMAGLNTDPTADSSYASIDYCFYMYGGSDLRVYESQTDRGSVGTYVAGDVLSVTYDGVNVRYLQNGNVLRTVAASANLKLYFDSSIVFHGLSNIKFGPMTSNNWADTGGTGKPQDNANNTFIDANGQIQGVSQNAGTAVRNSLISISSTGQLNGAGGGQITTLTAPDVRSTNELPNWSGYPVGVTMEFKTRSAIGAPGTQTYGILRTEKPWADPSGGYVTQTFKSGDGEWKRISSADHLTWGSWTPKLDRQISSTNIATYIATAAIDDAYITTLNASKINAGTIAADRIGANTIAANKLILSNFNNIITNPVMEYGTSGYSGGSPITAVTASSAPSGCPTSFAMKQECLDLYSEWFDVYPGEVYNIGISAAAGSGVTSANFGVGFRLWYTNGTTNDWQNATGMGEGNFPYVGSLWTTKSGQFAVPATVKKMAVWIHAEGYRTGTNPVPWYWTNLRVTRANDASLIVDGAITASKMTVAEMSKVVSGGVTTGGRVDITASNGGRIAIYDASNNLRVKIGYLL